MKRVAILGAGGFIGSRAVEMLHDGFDVVAVVRQAGRAAAWSRLDLPVAVADGLDRKSLERAFSGCEAVVASIAGSPATITGVCGPIVHAARSAGVKRIVHLSSQAVHGQSLAPRTIEETPFPRRQPFAYNRAKAEAEQRMHSLASAAGLDVVILRPGIVYGPRSRWTAGIADELQAGEAFLVRDSQAACNAIYVDNLVQAIALAIDADGTSDAAMFVNDAERLHWADLIVPIADALGLSAEAIRRPSLTDALGPGPSWSSEHILPLAKSALRKLPRPAVRMLRAATTVIDRDGAGEEGASYSREMALLQSNSVHLSNDKAGRLLGYRPIVTHAEAMRRSIAWLAAAGYPVR